LIRNLIVYNVAKAIAALLAENSLPSRSRKQDEFLPFSPDVDGKAVEELGRTPNASASRHPHQSTPQGLEGRASPK